MNPARLNTVLAFCFLVAALPAQVVVTGYTETGNLPRNDDGFSSAVALGFTINFGGTTYTDTFVSKNGFITFGGGSGAYWPNPLDADYMSNGYPDLPIIAAFFSDVDTRNELSGIVSWGTGLVNGRPAFVAKWPNVGEYSLGSDPNNFELILVSRSDLGPGSFDIHFVYHSITWTTATPSPACTTAAPAIRSFSGARFRRGGRIPERGTQRIGGEHQLRFPRQPAAAGP